MTFVVDRINRLIDFIPAFAPLVDNDRHQQIRISQRRAAGVDADKYLQNPVKGFCVFFKIADGFFFNEVFV